MTKRRVPDREIFDLEVDDRPSYVVMRRDCHLFLKGFLGDEIKLKSGDLPVPDPQGVRYYHFEGVSVRGASFVDSLDKD